MDKSIPSTNEKSDDSTVGNVMIMGVILVALLTMFGSAMLSKMIVDSNISALKISGAKAFYLADSGIQLGRRYLVFNSGNRSFGPLSIGQGSVTVVVEKTREYYPDRWSRKDVYKITSTATVGETTREVMELRYRGGWADKDFMLWRENVASEF